MTFQKDIWNILQIDIFKDNVENPKGFNREVGSGGTYLMAETYLANGYGAIPEAEMPLKIMRNL